MIAIAASGISLQTSIVPPSGDPSLGTFLGGIALAILAFKGFTTITNSGGEVTEPKKNVGRAIIISLAICLVVYLAVCFAVVLGTAIALDTVALGAFLVVKGSSDPLIVAVGLVSLAVVVAFERFYLRRLRAAAEQE
jgi:amino acid transporter